MLFTSYAFLVLVILTFLLYYLPATKRFQVQILIISSLIFYSYEQPILVLLLLFSAGINIFTSYYVVYGQGGNKKSVALTGVLVNLFVLAFFKYSPLFANTFFNATDSIGQFLLTLPLPIGISFFTFEGVSLVIDVYNQKYFDSRDVIPPSLQKHAQRTLLFISFFPHLVAGPIVKAHDFLPQIGNKKFSDINWESVFKTLVIGFFLKMVVANNLKDFTFGISYPNFTYLSSFTSLSLLFGYSIQIFADFAGYSLMAIGLASMFGYVLMDNFNFPYIATSFKNFWKRWHISLSTFLMEYLYVPLGGNRKGKIRTYINLMITMFLGGLWHGAAWSYAVWGSFHGGALAIERMIGNKIKLPPTLIVKILKGLMVFSFVTIAWLLFQLPEFEHVIKFCESVMQNRDMPDDILVITYIFLYSSPVIIYHLFYLLRKKSFFIKYRNFDYLIYGFLLFLIITNSGSSGAFIYFQF
ncbi:MAG: MBOAT family O-acyltransferase [Flavobacteriales bacterium]